MKAMSLTPNISADFVDLLLDYFKSNVIYDIAPIKGKQEDWQTKIILEKVNSSSEFEKTMQKT